ncbi:nucleosome assembly protein 1-like 3-like isoform 2, partial [Reticulomyxa filosa]
EEEEEENTNWVFDPVKDANDKSKYFSGLEKHGAKANTLKGSLRKNQSSTSLSTSTGSSTGSSSGSSSSNNGSGASPGYVSNTTHHASNLHSYAVPSRIRGAPLGSAPKLAPLNATHAHSKTMRKEEEVVGNMRYIYEVDDAGTRTCVRKLPIRNTLTDSAAHKLQD